MTRALFYPFCSKQCKLTRRFMVSADASVKSLLQQARRASAELGWETSLALPPEEQCDGAVGWPTLRIPHLVELDNGLRRIQWNTGWLKAVAKYDVVITTHDLLAIPLRCISERVSIATECGLSPKYAWPASAPLFPLAWRSSDLVFSVSPTLSREVAKAGIASPVWCFAYPDELLEPSRAERDIDVLFNARASATGYTYHLEFIEAMRGTALKVLFCDPTGYAKERGQVPLEWLPPEPLSGDAYYDALKRSRVIVDMRDDGTAGCSFLEAVAAGAFPVALCNSEHADVLGEDWPCYLEKPHPSLIAPAVYSALNRGLWNRAGVDVERVRSSVARYSYSAAWAAAKPCLEALA